MASNLSDKEIFDRVKNLERYWKYRNTKMKSWYQQLQMIDTLAQTDMESFVGNDPRAAFNLIGGILNQRVPHKFPADLIDVQEVKAAAETSRMFDAMWDKVTLSYRQRGVKWHKRLIDLLLATGWYSVFASITEDGASCIAEIWNPITVYPMWDDVLTQCAHIFSPGAEQIKRMALRNGWTIGRVSDRSVIQDYWWSEPQLASNIIHNAILIDGNMVKPDTIETRFSRIPIFISPVGGLPDMGSLAESKGGESWKGEIGQSFIATNENVYKSINKWWTFVMQLLRDTAQPRTYEKTNQAKNIIRPETWFKRGAHYKLGLQDDIGYVAPPGIPVEISKMQLDLEAMEQRGGPSWTMFGSIQQRMTAYAMAQVAATTNQIAGDYHRGIVDCISDIDNFWKELIENNRYKPYGYVLPTGIPEGVRLSANYELRIPGDIIQRATTGRMLNPEFELSEERIMGELFPEIKNPVEELAAVRAGKARKHPVYTQLSLIASLRLEATMLQEAKDTDGAKLYSAAADRLEQEIMGQTAGQAPPQGMQQAPPQAAPVRPRPEVAAQEAPEQEEAPGGQV